MASELIAEYLKDDIIEFLFTQIYRGNPESAIIFPSADEYVTIIYQEGKYILDNIFNSKNTFRKRFLYPGLTKEQRDYITFSLMYFVDMHRAGLPRFIQHVEMTKRKHGWDDDQIKKITIPMIRKADNLKMVQTLLEDERHAIHYEKSVFRDGIANKIKDIVSNADKILYLRNMIFYVKVHPFYQAYQVHYDNIISFCNVEIERIELSDRHQSFDVTPSLQTHNFPQKQPLYCLRDEQIVTLHSLFNGQIINNCECADFMKCFDIHNTPEIKPVYMKGQQNLMTYALSLINAINDKIALSNFNIRNYYQMKKRTLPKSKRLLENKIMNIIQNQIPAA